MADEPMDSELEQWLMEQSERIYDAIENGDEKKVLELIEEVRLRGVKEGDVQRLLDSIWE